MPICSLTISSKNKQSLINFLYFIFNNSKINLINKCKKIKIKKKVITVLKSPHVNKKAQEQFEIRTFSKQFYFYFYNSSKCLVTLKKIKTILFPDIKIKIKFLINNQNSQKVKAKFFNVSNYKITNLKLTSFLSQNLNFKTVQKKKYNHLKLNSLKTTSNYLKLLDSYGELNFYM